jgi:hypothetical protein
MGKLLKAKGVTVNVKIDKALMVINPPCPAFWGVAPRNIKMALVVG